MKKLNVMLAFLLIVMMGSGILTSCLSTSEQALALRGGLAAAEIGADVVMGAKEAGERAEAEAAARAEEEQRIAEQNAKQEAESKARAEREAAEKARAEEKRLAEEAERLAAEEERRRLANFSPEAYTEPTPASDFEYDLTESGEGIMLTRYKGNASVIVVPDTIEGFPVHEIRFDSNFDGNFTVLYVILSKNINYIHMLAFRALKEVYFVEDYAVTDIKYLSFNNCGKLTKVHLPSSVTNVKELDMSQSGITHLITWPELTEIVGNGYGYSWCENLKEVIIPETVTNIGYDAFSGSGVEKLVLSSNLKSIGKTAFADCYSLKEIVIPPELKSVSFNYDSFRGCSSLSLKEKATLKKLGYTGEF